MEAKDIADMTFRVSVNGLEAGTVKMVIDGQWRTLTDVRPLPTPTGKVEPTGALQVRDPADPDLEEPVTITLTSLVCYMARGINPLHLGLN